MNLKQHPIKCKSESKSRKEEGFIQDLKIANFILILYNLNMISERTFVLKYRDFIEQITEFLEI